jgi:esterase/lipase superfamily enzyme
MVFVHGYNTSFEDAVFKAAQIAYDTNFPGLPIAFSWPSKGNTAAYDYDRESALFSRGPLLELLHLIREQAGVSKVYVIAHSMGNQIVADALAGADRPGIDFRVTELVMAAPDMDRDVFEPLLPRLRLAADGMTLYASSADKAMLASSIKAGGVRAGDVPPEGPVVAEGLDTIDVTALGDDPLALNHGTYSSDRSLLDDIGRIMRVSDSKDRLRPGERSPQLRPVPDDPPPPKYWKYPD